MKDNLITVITTIQEPTTSVLLLGAKLTNIGAELIIAGDAKGPGHFELGHGTLFLSLDKQRNSGFSLANKLPINHYGRKNIGYLAAIQKGAGVIYETDDDNSPTDTWSQRSLAVEALVVEKKGWLNAYQFFTKDHIWPRGFPLDEVLTSFETPVSSKENIRSVDSPIQQGLANNSPDVDAVWRLIMGKPFTFEEAPSLYCPRGTWCPFNSQSTWWWPKAYPLMYLPSFCSFRMTDIWRSFIAQRCLWEIDSGVTFHAPEVFQERNQHDLMRDFSEEVPGYKRNKELSIILENLVLRPGYNYINTNLKTCYEALVKEGFFPEGELELLDCWLDDIELINLNN